MIPKKLIQKEIDAGSYERAIEMLNENIENQPQQWEWPYMRGRVYWNIGERGKAISDIERASSMEPGSAATHMLEHLRSIMDFFHTDSFNP